jgi:hypothetical protein
MKYINPLEIAGFLLNIVQDNARSTSEVSRMFCAKATTLQVAAFYCTNAVIIGMHDAGRYLARPKFPALLFRDNREADRMEFITTKPILPETGYLRLTQIIGSPKADPPIPAGARLRSRLL